LPAFRQDRKEWTKEDVRTLKTLGRAKTRAFTPHYLPLHAELNRRFGKGRYAYDACDSLLNIVKGELARHGIGTELLSDDERKDRAIALFAEGWALTPEDATAKWPSLHPLSSV
jgi:hypothetical protein